MQVNLENYKSAATQRALNEVNEALKNSRETERIMYVICETYFALQAIQLPNLPKDFDDYDARYGFTVKIEDQQLWGEIHKVTGPLMNSGKDAIGDGRTKMVRVTMTPERADLRYRVKFQFEKKLDKNDKCKVVTVREKTTQVVCKV